MKNLKWHLVLSFIIFLLPPSWGQTIITIAGIDIEGYNGDNIAAITAELSSPHAIILDSAGNFYISDFSNNRIRKVSTLGIVTTFVGTGAPGFNGDGNPATATKIYNPWGMAFDSRGFFYFSQFGNNCIRKIDGSGTVTTIAGTPGSPDGYFGDGGPATDALLAQPAGIAIDKFGNLYFADSRNNCVRKIDTYGIITTVAGIGALGYSGDGASATDALLSSPFGVAMDTSGNLYIADWENKRIRKVNTSGIIRTVAGTGYIGYSGDGGPATHANFMGPSGVAVDRNGNIFVADRESNRVRKIDNAGTITTVAGNGGTGYFGDGGPATSAQLYYPQSIAVNNVGAIYIADAANNRIRYVTNTTSFVTVLANENFIVYPNPAKNTLYFDLQSADKGTIRLMDITGRVMVSKLFSGATSFDISGLEPGIYLYQVLFDDGLTKSGKVVIEK